MRGDLLEKLARSGEHELSSSVPAALTWNEAARAHLVARAGGSGRLAD